MPRKKLTLEQEKEIKLLRANNKMYENTLEEAKMKGNKDGVARILEAKKDIVDKINAIERGTATHNYNAPTVTEVEPIYEKVNESDAMNTMSVSEMLKKHHEEEANKVDDTKSQTASNTEEISNTFHYGEELVNPTETTFNDIDSTAQYDVISLPSNGECYKGKISKVPVAYLTAYDENIIMSPNLYRDGLVIDYLLKNKVMNKNIDVSNLISGDVDAIILFLRATSYGTDFPVIVEDPETGERIESVVDLSKIKMKEFKLKGDEDGYFSYTLPISKADVKFKYLTRKEENDLILLAKLEGLASRATELKNVNKIIKATLSNDDILTSKDKTEIFNATRKIDTWAEEIEKKSNTTYSRVITNRLEMEIMAVNGNYDKEYIRNFIYTMPAQDSLKLRRYILDNEPGLNFEIEVERPESLGGGSFKTFLEWNDSVFLNIA